MQIRSTEPVVAPELVTDGCGRTGTLTQDQRRHEIAAILARGILRLHAAGQLAQELAEQAPPNDASEPTKKALEVSGTFRPHVTGG